MKKLTPIRNEIISTNLVSARFAYNVSSAPRGHLESREKPPTPASTLKCDRSLDGPTALHTADALPRKWATKENWGNPKNHTYYAYNKRANKTAQSTAVANAQHWAYLFNNGLYTEEVIMGSTNRAKKSCNTISIHCASASSDNWKPALRLVRLAEKA